MVQDTNLQSLLQRYKQLEEELMPLIKLNSRIKTLYLICTEYEVFKYKVSSKFAQSKTKIIYCEKSSIEMGIHIRKILSMLAEIRDILKDSIIKTKPVFCKEKDKCNKPTKSTTKELVDKYKSLQDQYQEILKNTLEQHNVTKWAGELRNIVLHGSSLEIGFVSLSKPGRYHQLHILCDYGFIANNKNLKNLNHVDYFYDYTVFILQLVHNGILSWADISEDELNICRANIEKRANILDLNSKLDKNILNNTWLTELEEFILCEYNEYKSSEFVDIAKFGGFKLSSLLEVMANLHVEYYEKLYKLISEAEKQNIKEIESLYHQIKHAEFPFINEPYNFSLNIQDQLISK